ncbi:hypothetical protein DUNSADRAFT_9034 [Dunaliella salina]|uniref:Dynein heavy chain coiled coil stalk domain-containing protein n=1 Tax=Dunaliella salina TaxID=3046 RepID=A0ABQ7GI86_DUNSA|nr:hypothetical protein DUNSADRAFT_9034 [Dunaliella salina]|eukprot:KAF5834333.1 hypothetical protein DUNSADRAFT_9034 [Dunaliella salina]
MDLCGEQNPKFLDRLTNFDVTSLNVVTLAQLTRLLAEPEFNIVQAAQVSAALKPLCWWVLSVAELVRITKQAEIKRGKIADAEARVATTEKYVRQLRAELNSAALEEQRQSKAKRNAEHDIAEMRKLIEDTDLSSQNLDQLEAALASLQSHWKSRLEEIEAQLPDLLGDATLAAAAVAYSGPLLSTQRGAALEAWHKLLLGAGGW